MASTQCTVEQLVHIPDILSACSAAALHARSILEHLKKSSPTSQQPTSSLHPAAQELCFNPHACAQYAITNSLNLLYPLLQVVVGENIDHKKASCKETNLTHSSSTANTSCPLSIPPFLETVQLQHVLIFVHIPLSQSLSNNIALHIGITVRAKPIAAVLVQSDNPITHAVIDAGVTHLPFHDLHSTHQLTLAVAPKLHNAVQSAIADFKPIKVIHCHSALDMLWLVATGKAHICILDSSTSLREIAALAAIISARAGIITDLFGRGVPFDFHNLSASYGIVASVNLHVHEAQGRTHAEFCHLLRMSMAFDHLLIHTGLISYNRPQATDILIGVDREPITAKWLSAVLRREVAEFRAEESDAVRYLMSDACRIKLRYVQHDQFPPAPSSLFLKRVFMEDLPHAKLKQRTVPHKITRDVASYQVESAFLSSKACKSFSANGTRIVAPFYIDLRPAPPGEPPIHSRFLLLLEDFSPEDGWFQADLFNKTEAVSSLEALASYHAFFWNFSCDNSYPELCEGVWKQATFWLPSRQSQDCFEKLASYWEMHRCSFGDVFDESVFGIDGAVNAKRFGYTLARFAPACAERVHAVGLDVSHPHRTLLHGDAKSANIFLKRHATDSTCKSQCEGDLFVGLIDFQWCGWGHPAVDVAYLIAGSTSSDVLFSDENNEDFLLERYYEHFLNCLINMGKVNTWAEAQQCMTSEELKSYYSDAIVDIARVVISNLWVRIKASPEVLKSRSKIRGSNSYNKDVCCAKWLIKRTTAILSSKLEQRRIP